MKNTLALLLTIASLHAERNTNNLSLITTAIRRTEGTHTYGVKLRGAKDYKGICERTVLNNYARWRGNEPMLSRTYMLYLADVYCPQSVDKVGNKNWKRNICVILKLNQ